MRQSFIVTIGIIAAIAIVAIVLIPPLYEEVGLQRNSIQEKEEVILELEKLVQKTEEWRSELFQEEESIETLDLFLPDEKDLPNLIVSLESLSAGNGMILKSISAQGDQRRPSLKSSQDGSSQGSFESLDLTLEMSGSYSAFKSFLRGLENNIRIMDVESIGFGSDDSADSIGNFSFTVSGTVYYQ